MAEYIVKPTGPFRKDLKLAKKRGLLLSDLYTVMDLLATGEPLPPKYRNHLHIHASEAARTTAGGRGVGDGKITPPYGL